MPMYAAISIHILVCPNHEMTMKTSNNIALKYWMILMAVSLFAVTAGCISNNSPQTETNESVKTPTTSTPLVIRTIPATNTTEPTVTSSVKPTATPTPTSTWTPTPTVTPTVTLTPPATLEPDLAKEEVKRLFKEEVDCEKACFWGIVPGETNLSEATDILKRLGIFWEAIYDEDEMEVYSTLVGVLNSARGPLELYTQNGVVENIRFGFSVWRGDDKIIPHSEWLAYSPETVLKRYGKPTRVEFGIDYPHEPGAPPGSVWYYLQMYFDQEDLIVGYYGGPSIAKERIKACPKGDTFIDGIMVWIGKDPEFPPGPAIPLEDATGLTMDEFYELMVNGNPYTCINLITEAFEVNP